MKKDYKFNQYYKSLNVFSIALILLSLIFLIFKGLNYGVDFKGGTLIEIRVESEKPDIEVLRSSFNKLNLGKISIKNFGSDNDFVVKFKRDELNDPEFIENLQKNLSQELTQDFSFRRVENVGPKVSSELLKAGVIPFLIFFLTIMPFAYFDSELSGLCFFSILVIFISVTYYSANRRFEFAGGILFGSILSPILFGLLLQLLISA